MSLLADVKELRVKRAKLVHDARQTIEKSRSEKRDLSPDEQAKWDQMMSDVQAQGQRIAMLEKQISAEAEVDADPAEADPAGDPAATNPDEPKRSLVRLGDGRMAQVVEPGAERRSRPDPAGNTAAGNPDRRRRSLPEYRKAFWDYAVHATNPTNSRAVAANSDITGGYLLLPTEMSDKIVKNVDNLLWLRKKATVLKVQNAQSLGAPAIDNDPADADWTSEILTGSEDSTMSFGGRELTPHPLAKRIKVSEKMLSMMGSFSWGGQESGTFSGAEGLINDRLAYKFAVSEEKAFMTGNGSQRPLGLFTASTRGISTGRDVVTGSATTFTYAGLVNAKYALKGQYLNEAEWLFHRDALKLIAGLVDGESRPLWEPNVQVGQPDRLLGSVINMSEYVPNTFTTGLYVGMFGVFKHYWIADAETFAVKRLNELYAETAQVGFIGRQDLDGMPVIEEAFARLKTS